MADPVYLVACVAQKGGTRARARDLYQSDWFKKARAFVEINGGRWFILSAEHGLLKPQTRIEPYDTTLSTMTASERRQWGALVRGQLDKTLGKRFRGEIIFLAGKHYPAPLLDYAADRARVPMAGLGIGQQKSWLKCQTETAREAQARAAQYDLLDMLEPPQ